MKSDGTMKQISLFETAYEDYKKEIRETPENIQTKENINQINGVILKGVFNDCPKCHVKPIVWQSPHMTIDGWHELKDVARCPVCGYMVADYYDIVEHWNKCNMYRVRDGKI